MPLRSSFYLFVPCVYYLLTLQLTSYCHMYIVTVGFILSFVFRVHLCRTALALYVVLLILDLPAGSLGQG
jgi:hypothetical protein